MQVLPAEQRLMLMQEFFGADGINFCWGRTPIGGNDMSLSTYTYNDVPYDWTQNSLVNIDRRSGTMTRNDEYYLLKHLSHFVQGGSHLLKTTEDKNLLAFVTKEGQKVIVVYNPSDSDSQKTITIDGKALPLTLKAKSINTIVL